MGHIQGLNIAAHDDEIVDEYDDEVTITFSRTKGFVKPTKYNSDGLIKRESDIVSGNLAYFLSVPLIIVYQSFIFLTEFFKIFKIFCLKYFYFYF